METCLKSVLTSKFKLLILYMRKRLRTNTKTRNIWNIFEYICFYILTKNIKTDHSVVSLGYYKRCIITGINTGFIVWIRNSDRAYSSCSLQLIINSEALQGCVLSPTFCVYKQHYNLRPA